MRIEQFYGGLTGRIRQSRAGKEPAPQPVARQHQNSSQPDSGHHPPSRLARLRLVAPRTPPADRTIVVLSALALEHRALQEGLPTPVTWQHPAGTVFYISRLSGTPVRVVTAMTGQGNNQTAVIAERAITRFGPAAVLFSGVAGALSDKVEVGDVVVGTRIYAYHGGEDGPDGFSSRPRVWEAPHHLEQLARMAARDRHDVHFRPIASGEVIIDSRRSPSARHLRRHYGDTVAIEMEGGGLAYAGHLNRTPVLSIRGISDRADGTKRASDRSGSQVRAAEKAAHFTLDLCRLVAADSPWVGHTSERTRGSEV